MRAIQKALTFDDVLLVPAHSTVLPREVRLTSRLTRSIQLNIPLLSAAMDTVTESRLAIALAQEGGIGIVHKNMSPRAQAAEVAKVKRFESGVVKEPITISPSMSVREVIEITRRHRISGLPVVEGKKVVGIVTNRDLRFEESLDQPVKNIMTPQKKLAPSRTVTSFFCGVMMFFTGWSRLVSKRRSRLVTMPTTLPPFFTTGKPEILCVRCSSITWRTVM